MTGREGFEARFYDLTDIPASFFRKTKHGLDATDWIKAHKPFQSLVWMEK